MAERVAGKASKRTVKKPAAGRKRGKSAAAGGKQAKPDKLAAECARLRAELRLAKNRIKVLESRQAEVLNRIDWAIDSLQNVLDDEK